jgi:hypothetical protein
MSPQGQDRKMKKNMSTDSFGTDSSFLEELKDVKFDKHGTGKN